MDVPQVGMRAGRQSVPDNATPTADQPTASLRLAAVARALFDLDDAGGKDASVNDIITFLNAIREAVQPMNGVRTVLGFTISDCLNMGIEVLSHAIQTGQFFDANANASHSGGSSDAPAPLTNSENRL
jgi:hypothetical protein